MAKPKSVVGLLRALPGDELARMRELVGAEIERHRTEVARLETELALINEAQSRSTRRKAKAIGASPRSAQSDRRGRNGLPRAELVKYIEEYGKPVHPTELSDFLATKGISIEPKALHTGMTRLEKNDHKLVKFDPSVWGLPEWKQNGSNKNAATDPLFADDARQSQDSRRASES